MTQNIFNIRFLVLFLLLVGSLGCRSSSTERFQVLNKEGYEAVTRQTKLIEQWAREFGQAFTPQTRAQFPANRDWLNERAQKVSALIDESSRLANEAVAKFEEAGGLTSDDKQKRACALFASSIRKDVEIGELFKAAAKVAADPTVTDAKVYGEKFDYYIELMKQKQKEKDDEFAEGKRLLGK